MTDRDDHKVAVIDREGELKARDRDRIHGVKMGVPIKGFNTHIASL